MARAVCVQSLQHQLATLEDNLVAPRSAGAQAESQHSGSRASVLEGLQHAAIPGSWSQGGTATSDSRCSCHLGAVAGVRVLEGQHELGRRRLPLPAAVKHRPRQRGSRLAVPALSACIPNCVFQLRGPFWVTPLHFLQKTPSVDKRLRRHSLQVGRIPRAETSQIQKRHLHQVVCISCNAKADTPI